MESKNQELEDKASSKNMTALRSALFSFLKQGLFTWSPNLSDREIFPLGNNTITEKSIGSFIRVICVIAVWGLLLSLINLILPTRNGLIGIVSFSLIIFTLIYLGDLIENWKNWFEANAGYVIIMRAIQYFLILFGSIFFFFSDYWVYVRSYFREESVQVSAELICPMQEDCFNNLTMNIEARDNDQIVHQEFARKLSENEITGHVRKTVDNKDEYFAIVNFDLKVKQLVDYLEIEITSDEAYHKPTKRSIENNKIKLDKIFMKEEQGKQIEKLAEQIKQLKSKGDKQ